MWFTRGMIWLFSFHHEEAAACFTKAVEADPGLPMAHWGIAYAHGPNYNFSAFEGYYQESNKPSGFPSQKVAAEEAETAASALQALEAEGVTATVVERALIRALQLRMTWPAQPDAAKLLTTFSDEMRILYGEHAGDADVAMCAQETPMLAHHATACASPPAPGAFPHAISNGPSRHHPRLLPSPPLALFRCRPTTYPTRPRPRLLFPFTPAPLPTAHRSLAVSLWLTPRRVQGVCRVAHESQAVAPVEQGHGGGGARGCGEPCGAGGCARYAPRPSRAAPPVHPPNGDVTGA